jgi:NitT/TauT family transport system substrate-binding protein
MNRTQLLRQGLHLTAAGAYVASVRRPAFSQTPSKLRVAGIPNDIGVASAYAFEQGFFKKYGLDVDLVVGGSGASVAAAVVGGALDVGSGNMTSLATAHERGVPFVLIAPSGAWSSKTPTGGLLVPKTSPVTSAKDMAGKVVGVTIVRAISEVEVRAWLDQNGVSSDSAKFLELPYSAMPAALTAGRIDAASVEEPAYSAMIADGTFRSIGAPGNAIAPLWTEGGYFVLQSFAKSHPDVVTKFANAMAETDDWANKNPAATARILSKYMNAPVNPNMTRCFYPERLRAQDLQPLIDASAKYGVLKASFPARELLLGS